MPITVRPIAGSRELELFIALPLHLSDRRPNQVPPLLADERELHDIQRNLSAQGCEVAHWFAEREGRIVGRVMGIVHGPYNRRHGERTARFFQLDAESDPSVVRALLDQVETWARERGMTRIIGPYGFSDKDPQGLQVEGFEHLPVLATPTNAAHLPKAVEACGYLPFADALSYRLDMPAQLPDIHERIAERVLRNGRFRVVELRSKRDLRPWILPVLRLVNDTYSDLLGFAPMSEAEMRKLAGQYMPVLDPALVKIVAEGKEPVAFVVAMPDMSEGLQRAKGRIFPFGWWHIMQAMKRSKQLDLFLGAVRRDLQGMGLTCVLARELFREGRARGMTHLDSHLVLENNVRMRAELERLGGEIWKRYRVYVKEL
jgi:GNAT superfamily N-acetyltransferase